jgi:hypothetical protein
MNTIDIYRDNLFLYTIKPEDDSTQLKKIMGENELRVNFVENQYIEFKIGDKTTLFDEDYYLNTVPNVTKKDGNKYEYQMILKATKDALSKVQYMFLGDDNSLKESVFSLTGTAADFISLLIRNTRRLLPAFDFTTGVIQSTDYKTISFDSENCLDALAKISEAFELEYWVTGTVISLETKAKDTGYVFKHGKRKGLYELIRKGVNDDHVITRLYAFGSDKNLPENYRNFSKRLKLPLQDSKTITNLTWEIFVILLDNSQQINFEFDPATDPGVTGLTILRRLAGSSDNFSYAETGPNTSPRSVTVPAGEWEFIFRSEFASTTESSQPVVVNNSAPQPALPQSGDIISIEKNIDKYGVSEGTVVMDDVYPHRTGTVTSVDAGNFYRFHDSGIDFDVNDFLLPGMTAKVTFNTGQLSGYTFDISEYNDGAKRFTILKNKNERVFELPSFDLKPSIGDKYVLTDIKMPTSYITAAENELLLRAQSLLDKLSEPQLSYQLILDPVYIKEKNITLNIGDMVWIVDNPMMIQRKMRIVSSERNITNQYQYSLEIADALAATKFQTLTSGQVQLTDSVNNITSTLQNNSILNNRVVGDLIMTGESSIKFENLQTGTGLTPIGIDSSGRIFKI